MSSGEIVRKPLRRSERSSRALDQRLFLRFPRLLVAYLRLLDSLPPRSRLRQAAIWRAVRLALGGWNRRDLDALQIGFRPDYEFFPAHEVVEAGLSERCYRGPAGFRKFWSSFYEAWGG